MMENNWENFLKNLGEWEGSFTSVSLDGELLKSTPSILNLEGLEDNQLVKFRLRRFGSGDYSEPPISDHAQEYRSIGRQNIFFETGAFSKGSLQLAPFSEFGAEYGFVAEDRRLRFVQLYDKQGNLRDLILIREFRSGTDARERSMLEVSQLIGNWQGTARTAYSDWRPSETYATSLEIKEIGNGLLQQQQNLGETTITSKVRVECKKLLFDGGNIPRQTLLLPDGTSSNTPLEVKLRQEFFVEMGWLVEDNIRQRLIRNYNEKGQWVSATHIIEHKIE
ncbi:MAG: DUF3598 family protein [Cyanobacteria bacterium P01_F01_bin.143]